MKHFLQTCILAGGIALTASIAQAATLTVGGSTFVTGTIAAADPELAGVVQNDDILTASLLNVPDPSSIFFVGFDIQNRVTQSNTQGTMTFGW